MRNFEQAIVFVTTLLLIQPAYAEDSLGLLGDADRMDQLSPEVRSAYDWGGSVTETRYVSFQEINAHPDVLKGLDALWWHYDASTNLPSAALRPAVLRAIFDTLYAGSGLFLSGFAAQYVSDLQLTAHRPSLLKSEPSISGNWGIYQKQSHPIFKALPETFRIMSDGFPIRNNLCWWDDAGQYGGTWLGDVERRGNVVACGEFAPGRGKVLTLGVGAFEWNDPEGRNRYRGTLERFTANILVYLGAVLSGRVEETPGEGPVDLKQAGVRVGFLSTQRDVATLSSEAKAAYTWLADHAETRLIPFGTLAGDPSVLDQVDVLWWHQDDTMETPAAAQSPGATGAIQSFLAAGNGLFLSGFACQYVVDLGIDPAGPTTTAQEPGPSGDWGYQPRDPSHPIFAGFDRTYYTLSAGCSVDNSVCWWDDPGALRGVWLADTEWSGGKATMVEFASGRGKVIATGTGAYDWFVSDGVNRYRNHLEQLTENILVYLSRPAEAPGAATLRLPERELMHRWTFDGADGSEARDEATGASDQVVSYLHPPGRRAGPVGQALRFDGYSTYVFCPSDEVPDIADGLTVEAWIAARNYPTAFAPFINQHDDRKGFAFGVSPYGQWGLKVATGNQWRDIWAREPLPLSRWVHVAATFDKDQGLTLYMNGAKVDNKAFQSQPLSFAPDTDLQIGRDNQTGFVADLFPTGMFSGMMDEVNVYGHAREPGQIRADWQAGHADMEPDLSREDIVSRDPQRPVYHPLPAAAWANEPHGLIYIDGRYELFYQANPSGPYWNHIKWGHMSSDDLVHWEQRPIALRPEAGDFDSVGCWSGHAVNNNGVLTLVYTGINGRFAGVGLATPLDPDKNAWQKNPSNPVIPGRPSGNFHDFRDPFVWREGDTWYLIIGAGGVDVGGTAMLYRSPDLLRWKYLGQFFTGDIHRSGFFWEMPIFLDMGDRHLFGVTTMPATNVYWTGRWESEEFTVDQAEPRRVEIINHLLSPSVARDADGRWTAIGIIPDSRSGSEQIKAGWSHTFSLPRVWTLLPGGALAQKPHPALQTLREAHNLLTNITVNADTAKRIPGIQGDTLELLVEADISKATTFGLKLRTAPDRSEETVVEYNRADRVFVLDRRRSSLNPSVTRDLQTGPFELKSGEPLRLHIFLDKSVLEVFANKRGAFATRVYPTREDSVHIELFAKGGPVTVTRLDAWKMKGIW